MTAQHPPRAYAIFDVRHGHDLIGWGKGEGEYAADYVEYLPMSEHLEIVERRVREARAEAFDLAAKIVRDECYHQSKITEGSPDMEWLRPHEFMAWPIAVQLDEKAKRERAELGVEGVE